MTTFIIYNDILKARCDILYTCMRREMIAIDGPKITQCTNKCIRTDCTFKYYIVLTSFLECFIYYHIWVCISKSALDAFLMTVRAFHLAGFINNLH